MEDKVPQVTDDPFLYHLKGHDIEQHRVFVILNHLSNLQLPGIMVSDKIICLKLVDIGPPLGKENRDRKYLGPCLQDKVFNAGRRGGFQCIHKVGYQQPDKQIRQRRRIRNIAECSGYKIPERFFKIQLDDIRPDFRLIVW